MASSPHNKTPSISTSSDSGGVVTPSASTDTPSHTSAACSNYSTFSNQPYRPSHSLRTYLAQSPYEDASLYGRFAGQPPTAEVWGRIAEHMARMQREIDLLSAQSGSETASPQ